MAPITKHTTKWQRSIQKTLSNNNMLQWLY